MDMLGKQINSFKKSHDLLINSLDLNDSKCFEDALEKYSHTWFKTGDPYLTIAFRLSKYGEKRRNHPNIVKWEYPILISMLDEIFVEDDIDTNDLIDLVKCALAGKIPMARLEKAIFEFDKTHHYRCPDSFKSKWYLYGSYATLMYDAMYDPNVNTNEVKAKCLRLMVEQDHDVDFELLKDIYEKYSIKE
jgi:hypothetical protein